MTRPDLRRQRTLYLAMHIALGGALLSLIPSALAADAPNTPQSPDILLGPLFSDVQSAKLFPDQKPSPMPFPRVTP
jgi:alpha,alpha-trehalase